MKKLSKAISALKNDADQPNASDRAALVAKLRTLGIPAGKLAQLVIGGKSRKELRDDFITYLKGLPKG